MCVWYNLRNRKLSVLNIFNFLDYFVQSLCCADTLVSICDFSATLRGNPKPIKHRHPPPRSHLPQPRQSPLS